MVSSSHNPTTTEIGHEYQKCKANDDVRRSLASVEQIKRRTGFISYRSNISEKFVSIPPTSGITNKHSDHGLSPSALLTCM